MKCPNCGFENRPDARFCKHCRQPMQTISAEQAAAPPPPPAGICPVCGATAKPGARFCPRCGKPLPAAPAPPAPAAPTPYTPLPPTVPSMSPLPSQPPPPGQPPTYAQPPSVPPPPAPERGGPKWVLWLVLAAACLCAVLLIVAGVAFRHRIATVLGIASPTALPTETPTVAATAPTWTPTPSSTATAPPPTETLEATAPTVSPELVFGAMVSAAVSTGAGEVAVGDLITVTVTVTNTGGLSFVITGYQLVGQVAPFLELMEQSEPSGLVIDPGGADWATFVLSAKNAGEVGPRVIVTMEVQTTPPFVELKESPPIPITVR